MVESVAANNKAANNKVANNKVANKVVANKGSSVCLTLGVRHWVMLEKKTG